MQPEYTHEDWMSQALALAHKAEAQGEVPVGAIVVYEQQLIGQGWNQPIASHDPSAHAEMVAIRDAAKAVGNYRLLNATLYVTLEPCAMCAGAIIHARIKQVVFGAFDPKAGAAGSVFDLLGTRKLNHCVEWQGGCMAEACGLVLKTFFQQRRQAKPATNR
jgi:tRNA(adenine34) deaminase